MMNTHYLWASSKPRGGLAAEPGLLYSVTLTDGLRFLTITEACSTIWR